MSSLPTETGFRRALLRLVQTCKDDLNDNPTGLVSLITDLGAIGAANRLLNSPSVSDGYGRLASERRLDLTVEALVLEPEWSVLFSAEQLQTARSRVN